MYIYPICFLILFFFNSSFSVAVDELTAEQIYKKIKLYKSLNENNVKFNLERMSRGEAIKTSNYAPWHAENDGNEERDKEINLLTENLAKKAQFGEPLAVLYSANLLADNELYDLAIEWYKRAGAAGVSTAYWNIAVMYANGLGKTTSKLAALEYYYLAGVGFLNAGDRAQALASLEAMQAIRMEHELSKRLERQLNKTAPK